MIIEVDCCASLSRRCRPRRVEADCVFVCDPPPHRHASFYECMLLSSSVRRCIAAVGKIDPGFLLEGDLQDHRLIVELLA